MFCNIHVNLTSFLRNRWSLNSSGESLLWILKFLHHPSITLRQTLSIFGPFNLFIHVREFSLVRLEDSTSTESEGSQQICRAIRSQSPIFRRASLPPSSFPNPEVSETLCFDSELTPVIDWEDFTFNFKNIRQRVVFVLEVPFTFSNFFFFRATAPIWALACLRETVRFTSVY
jgi:hypothetical protein